MYASIKEEGEGDIHKINETFEKSYLLIGLSKFAQTFVVRFLKSFSIHSLCINAWGSSPLRSSWVLFNGKSGCSLFAISSWKNMLHWIWKQFLQMYQLLYGTPWKLEDNRFSDTSFVLKETHSLITITLSHVHFCFSTCKCYIFMWAWWFVNKIFYIFRNVLLCTSPWVNFQKDQH